MCFQSPHLSVASLIALWTEKLLHLGNTKLFLSLGVFAYISQHPDGVFTTIYPFKCHSVINFLLIDAEWELAESTHTHPDFDCLSTAC